jgi:hypothetical protein
MIFKTVKAVLTPPKNSPEKLSHLDVSLENID